MVMPREVSQFRAGPNFLVRVVFFSLHFDGVAKLIKAAHALSQKEHFRVMTDII